MMITREQAERRIYNIVAWYEFFSRFIAVDYSFLLVAFWHRELDKVRDNFTATVNSLKWSQLATQTIATLANNYEPPPVDCNNEQDFERLGQTMFPEEEPDKGKGHGYIYFAYLPTQDIYKVGKSKSPEKRIKSILGSSPIKDTPVLFHVLETDDMDYAEKEFHHYYAAYRMVGEWFKLPPHVTETIKAIKRWQVVKNPELPLKDVA